jgi:hypothetical protein
VDRNRVRWDRSGAGSTILDRRVDPVGQPPVLKAAKGAQPYGPRQDRMSNSCRWSSVMPAKGNRFASRYAFARTASSARSTASAMSLASDTRTFTQFGAPPSGVTRSSSPPSSLRR